MENAECSHQKRICMQLFESLGKESSIDEPEEENVSGVASGNLSAVEAEEGNNSNGNGSKISFVITGLDKHVLGKFDVPAKSGETLYQIMLTAVQAGKMTFQTKMTKWGRYVTSVDGCVADESKHQYWEIEDNGVRTPLGIDQYKPLAGSEIEFKLTVW